MAALFITVQRFVDDHFPGFVECSFVDSDGKEHRFVEKVPIVTTVPLSFDSAYPRAACMDCEIQDEWTDALGRKLARVDTGKPWGIESTLGQTKFTVLREQIAGD